MNNFWFRRLASGSKCTDIYIKFTALEDGTFSFVGYCNYIEYSIDDGETWTRSGDPNSGGTRSLTSPTITTGNSILWRGLNLTNSGPGSSNNDHIFSSSGQCNVSGRMDALVGPHLPVRLTYNSVRYQFRNCFRGMKIVDASELMLCEGDGESGMSGMFMGCNLMINGPKQLPYISFSGAASMFAGCTSLVTAPKFPKGSHLYSTSACSSMFAGCTSLVNVPDIHIMRATYTGAFYNTFEGCTSLTKAPCLILDEDIKDDVTGQFSSMFKDCTSLNYIKVSFRKLYKTNTANWVSNVAPTGTFVKHPLATWDIVGPSGVPVGWTVEYDRDVITDFNPNHIFNPVGYLTFSPSDTTFIGLTKKLDKHSIYVSKDKLSWHKLESNDCLEFHANENFYVCGFLPSDVTIDETYYTQFAITGKVSISGNLNSIWNYQNLNVQFKQYQGINLFKDCVGITSIQNLIFPDTVSKRCYRYMFSGCTSLTTASTLPATTLVEQCYHYMFQNCTSLTTAPVLPAITLAEYCYAYMFEGCTSLITAPALPAETLVSYCYVYMFKDCTSLTTAPTLPATTLVQSCYSGMFQNCTSLTTAPQLPAETLASYCYGGMFKNCTSLATAPELPATTLASYCYQEMFSSCTSLTTAPQLLATNLSGGDHCYFGMFKGCTSLITTPTLPATTLAGYCYWEMFKDCTNLTTALALPAETLTQGCYDSMFYNCTSLTTVPELPATTLVNYCYYEMFMACHSLQNVPKLPAETLVPYCYSYMFNATKCNYVNAMFLTAPTSGLSTPTTSWLNEVPKTGIFVKNINATWNVYGDYAVPSGWTIIYFDPSDNKYYIDQQKSQECDDHGNLINN